MKALYEQTVPVSVNPLDVLSEQTRAGIDAWLKKYPPERKRSAILAALRLAQDQNEGHLTDPLITACAAYLDLPAAYGYEVASFYSMYHIGPSGRHKVSICTNISCMLNGADALLAHAESKLGCKWGGSSADGRIHLVEEYECLAGCVRAPMALIDGKFHENLTAEKLDQVLDGLK